MPSSAVCFSWKQNLEWDQDGDLIVRKETKCFDCWTLQSEEEASLQLDRVGWTLWPVSILLCEYLLDLIQKESFCHTFCVELGAGIGLSGRVLASASKCSVCLTDLPSIISHTKYHVDLDIKQGHYSSDQVKVEAFDWAEMIPEFLSSATLFLASDVFYDDDLTDVFINMMKHFLILPGREFIIASELRINFSVEHGCALAHSFQYAMTCFEEPFIVNGKMYRFHVERLSNIGNYSVTHYDRRYEELLLVTAFEVEQSSG